MDAMGPSRAGPSPALASARNWLNAAFGVQLLLSAFMILLGITSLLAVPGAGAQALGAFLIGGSLVFLAIAWRFALTPAGAGDPAAARPAALLLGILGVPLGFIVVGVLYLIAYAKLGTAAAAPSVPSYSVPAVPPAPGIPSPAATAPAPVVPAPAAASFPPPWQGVAVTAGLSAPTPSAPAPAPAPSASGPMGTAPADLATAAAPSGDAPDPRLPSRCPKCGLDADWIPDYHRYYCYTCNQYVPR